MTPHQIHLYQAKLIQAGQRLSDISGMDSKDIDTLEKHRSNYKYNCDKWAVVTTVFEPPTEAVRRLMYRNDWCVVVAGDKGKPSLEVNNILYLCQQRTLII